MHPYAHRLIHRVPPRLRPAATLTARTVDGAVTDRLPGLAAEIAFWSLVSLPALAIAALATTTLVLDQDGGQLRDQVLEAALDVAAIALTPEAIDSAARPALELLLDTSGAGVVSFAFLVAVWTASRAVRVLLTTLALTYDRAYLRSPLKTRLVGVAITLVGLVIAAILAPLLLAGPGFGATLVEWIGRDPIGLAELWRVAYWPATVLSATLAIALLFHLGVPGHTPWRRDLPGAVLTTAVWLLGSVALRTYASFVIGEGTSAYGPLAGPIVLLLWLWLTGLAVLLGGELNAQIERLWPTDPQLPGLAETIENDDEVTEPDPADARTADRSSP